MGTTRKYLAKKTFYISSEDNLNFHDQTIYLKLQNNHFDLLYKSTFTEVLEICDKEFNAIWNKKISIKPNQN